MANMHVEIQYVHLYCLSSTQNETLQGTNVSGDIYIYKMCNQRITFFTDNAALPFFGHAVST